MVQVAYFKFLCGVAFVLLLGGASIHANITPGSRNSATAKIENSARYWLREENQEVDDWAYAAIDGQHVHITGVAPDDHRAEQLTENARRSNSLARFFFGPITLISTKVDVAPPTLNSEDLPIDKPQHEQGDDFRFVDASGIRLEPKLDLSETAAIDISITPDDAIVVAPLSAATQEQVLAAIEPSCIDLFYEWNAGPAIEFSSSQSGLTANSKQRLDELALSLSPCSGLKLTITGHTDATGSAYGNQRLSLTRAQRVATYLQSTSIGPLEFSAVGAGESEPLFSNKTRAGRAKNRRIEFSLTEITKDANEQ